MSKKAFITGANKGIGYETARQLAARGMTVLIGARDPELGQAATDKLRDTPIKVNAANPGYTATDLNGHSGFRTPEQGAEPSVHLATLPADGPTGTFWGHVWGSDRYALLDW
ncbi:SDR family NAD(P)-dependent oxidoreductase [Nocardia tengchongensis]|uniref:SDR family NAD(P)-dependent oxidoreductase n=1 Tax=Nocardia tengchongensis TaxID=2055889 RepID=UPI003678D9AD